ncbi:DUF302 domain-containing protein [Pontibacter sp. JH31]|uniref:DUF302 domain-containing protein n=1 Tax=Pontibacter aquaedesilientis TaxID=2766980 RepID=A0ABR7XK82_9BACT|nr:DUF302 domain-containing protein [Pontibacter aquaedesilientis]MBD1397796.1 DUF302 domain-containing protein [Pontibacter aquaedesilientis]
MKQIALLLSILICTACANMAQPLQTDNLITKQSAYSMDETLSKLRAAIQTMGISLVAEVDHAKAAADNGLALRPTHVLIFGNPQVGTTLMQADQRTGLDLPLRLLVWQDENGKVYLSYHRPSDLKQDYRLREQQAVLDKIGNVFEKLSEVVRE